MQCTLLITVLLIFYELLINCCNNVLATESASISEFPFLATLRFRKTEEQFCSGAIVSSTHIATAARCFSGKDEPFNDVIVVVGTGDPNGKGFKHEIRMIAIHPDYTGEISITGILIKNIAIVQVKKPFKFNDKTKEIELAENPSNNQDTATVAGWGMFIHNTNERPKPLAKTSMSIIDPERCTNLVKHIIHTGQLCAFDPKNSNELSADQGGPLVSNNVLIGIFSYRSRISDIDPTLYTSISEALNFILPLIKK